MSIEDFERLPDDGSRRELVRGQVVKEPPAGFRHGGIAARIAGLLDSFVRQNDLGEVVTAETGFVLFDEPPTVRAPDVAFVTRERLTFDPDGFAPLAPDLAVEIVSPSNTVSEIHHKVMDYLDAGTRLVWVVEPRTRSVTAYRSLKQIRLLTGDDEIDGADVLPGLRLKVSELFRG
ncbi:MAG: Uma2 family endonuclease [Gemmatimonadota bacterium]